MSFFKKSYSFFLNYGGILGLGALSVFSDATKFKDFGGFGMLLLNIIMIISPLALVFPRVKLFTGLKGLRKPLGIIAGCYMLAHSIGYFMHYRGMTNPISMISDSHFWSLDSGLMWGFLASIISFALLITSNAFSVKLLKEKWKYLHRLGHFLYVFVILHIIFVTGNMGATIAFGIYTVLHILVFFKVEWK